jgi:hypothetical protein
MVQTLTAATNHATLAPLLYVAIGAGFCGFADLSQEIQTRRIQCRRIGIS